MPVNLGTPEIYTGPLLAGQLIEFSYNGTIRWGVVVTPDWKDNCDCYVFDSKEDVPEEVLDTIALHPELPTGILYSSYRETYTFKSFKLEKMMGIRNHPFTTYSEEKDVDDEVLEGKLIIDMEAGTISGPDHLINALLYQGEEE